MPEVFTHDGGMFCFTETVRCSVEISGGTGFCEKTVEVLSIRDIVFSLPEHGYIDQAEEAKMLTKDNLGGSVVWTLPHNDESITIPLDDSGGTLTFDGAEPMFSPFPSWMSWAGHKGCLFLSGQKDRQKPTPDA